MIVSEVFLSVSAPEVQSIRLKTGKININQNYCIRDDKTLRLCCH
jgi:hypothetical protein